MIENPKNGVSHPKNYLLKKLPPPNYFEKYFFAKFYYYNDRKTQKSGKPAQK